jgi:predicted unusual protein kinase regulating ubiquinone biosynthesis (AarF/ABC1/UbiB family)
VKIQYPGVAQAIHSDLQNVDTLLSTMSAVIPKANFKHFMDDASSRIEEECDYTIESQNQRDFERAWAGDPWVVIAKTHEALSTRRVLTSEFLHAQEWKEMLQIAPKDLKQRYSETLFRFVFTSLFQHGIFNGDPHPGNYLFYPVGQWKTNARIWLFLFGVPC